MRISNTPGKGVLQAVRTVSATDVDGEGVGGSTRAETGQEVIELRRQGGPRLQESSGELKVFDLDAELISPREEKR